MVSGKQWERGVGLVQMLWPTSGLRGGATDVPL